MEQILDDRTRWKQGRMSLLRQRQQILSAIREDLASQDFLEIETPLLVKSTSPDAHIDSIEAGEGYLVTSTEFQIKRMIVGGFQKVFTLTKNFRAFERGRYHSTEFTMLEWARADDTLRTIEDDTIRFIRKAFRKLHAQQNTLNFNEYEIDIMGDWERLTVREAFDRHLGMKNLEDFSLDPLCHAAKEAGVEIPADIQHDQDLVISHLLDLLQSHLGKHTPTFLQEWPAYMTSSAPISANDPHVAERTELYIGGVEIANGFPFLRDAVLQKTLFLQQLQRRKELGKPLLKIDEKFLDSLALGLPSGAGMALGVDRLVMVLTGASCLADVQGFSWDEL